MAADQIFTALCLGGVIGVSVQWLFNLPVPRHWAVLIATAILMGLQMS